MLIREGGFDMGESVYTKRELMNLLRLDEGTLRALERQAGMSGRRSQWYTAREANRIKDLWLQKKRESEITR